MNETRDDDDKVYGVAVVGNGPLEPEDDKIAPCPFCGGNNTKVRDWGLEFFGGESLECGGRGPSTE